MVAGAPPEEHGLRKGDFAAAQELITELINSMPIDVCADDDRGRQSVLESPRRRRCGRRGRFPGSTVCARFMKVDGSINELFSAGRRSADTSY